MDRNQLIEDALREAVRMGIGWPKSELLDRWVSEKVAEMSAVLTVFEGAGSFLPVASDVQETAHTDDERAKGEPGLRAHVRNLTGATDAELDALGGFQGEPSDAQADAAHIAFHEFCFGPNEPLSDRDLGIGRQAWKVALRAAAETGGER